MVEKTISTEDVTRLRVLSKKAGIRKTCTKADTSIDTYWNIVYARSHNASAYNKLLNAAIDLVTEGDDHAE
jgi:hypothetical protein